MYIQKEWTPTASLSTSRNRGCLIIFKYLRSRMICLNQPLIYFESRYWTSEIIFKSSISMAESGVLDVDALNLSGSDQTRG